MVSKTLIAKERSARFVISAARTHRERIVESFLSEFPEATPSALRHSMALLIDTVTEELERRFSEYESAERALSLERSDDAAILSERNEAAAQLRALLLEIRQAAGNATPELPEKLGFVGSTPRDPGPLVAQGKLLLSHFETMDAISSQVLRAYVFKPALYRDELREATLRMEQAWAAALADGRENDAALVDRDRASARYDQCLSVVADVVGAFLRGGGEAQLASRVRGPGRMQGTLAIFEGEGAEAALEELQDESVA